MNFLERIDLWNKSTSIYNQTFRYNPYFIAEIGVNHEGSLTKAKELIISAKNGGANAVKFQSYKAEKLTIQNSPAYWDQSEESTNSQYELFKKYDSFEAEDYFELKKFCEENEVEFLTTPFDIDFVDELDEILNFYKVASADLTNYQLLKKIAKKNKPIILSTGASTISEIKSTLNFLSQYKVDVILNHCVLSYPAPLSSANLGMLLNMSKEFPNIIGYSDHTVPDDDHLVLMCAVSLGATVLEKHFTLDKTMPGNDHYHSYDECDLKEFNKKIQTLRTITGKESKEVLEVELPARENARRSLVYFDNYSKGLILKEEMIVAKRPGTGISPSKFEDFIGRTLNVDVNKDEQINPGHFL
tara:strand:+ start:5744 stop:6817 length:1074 start_codon:yes stop_codon:yes gene_type:complete